MSLQTKLIHLAFRHPELRGDLMPLLKEAGAKQVTWAEDEVLLPHKRDIQRFIENFLREAQDLHKSLDSTYKQAQKTVAGGDQVKPRDVEAALRQFIESHAGKDDLGDLLTKALVYGSYIL